MQPFTPEAELEITKKYFFQISFSFNNVQTGCKLLPRNIKKSAKPFRQIIIM